MSVELNPYPWLTPNGLWKPISHVVETAAQAVSVDIFQSDGYYQLRSVRESHSVVSTSGTLQVEVLTSGQNADDGVDQLSAALSLATVADTPQAATLIETPTLIKPGDRVGIVFGGVLTGLIGMNVTVHLERLRKGEV